MGTVIGEDGQMAACGTDSHRRRTPVTAIKYCKSCKALFRVVDFLRSEESAVVVNVTERISRKER